MMHIRWIGALLAAATALTPLGAQAAPLARAAPQALGTLDLRGDAGQVAQQDRGRGRGGMDWRREGGERAGGDGGGERGRGRGGDNGPGWNRGAAEQPAPQVERPQVQQPPQIEWQGRRTDLGRPPQPVPSPGDPVRGGWQRGNEPNDRVGRQDRGEQGWRGQRYNSDSGVVGERDRRDERNRGDNRGQWSGGQWNGGQRDAGQRDRGEWNRGRPVQSDRGRYDNGNRSDDRGRYDNGNRGYDRGRYDNGNRGYDRSDRYDNRRGGWNRQWRDDRRYDWRGYRSHNAATYRLGNYYSPYRQWNYRRLSVGFSLWPLFYSNRYWINDPWSYRLPDAYGPYRWVRYYDDALLVDVDSGDVVDVIYDVFW